MSNKEKSPFSKKEAVMVATSIYEEHYDMYRKGAYAFLI